MSALLEAHGLVKKFDVRRSLTDRLARRPAKAVHAVGGVDLALAHGETLGLIGESGCGKSTLGRLLVKLLDPTAGDLRFEGVSIAARSDRDLRATRRRMQFIFQDPYASLNPRRSVREILQLPLILHGVERSKHAAMITTMMDRVGLARTHIDRYPHQFSGGQRQRIGIARALILSPRFVVCDEPVSALDVSVQAQILALLGELRDEMGLTMLFISHDLAVVAYLAQRVAVMYLGKIVEEGPTDEVIEKPAHPYTRTLLASVPRLGQTASVSGAAAVDDLPSPLDPPSGCPFHPRCPSAGPRCAVKAPELLPLASGRGVSCHLYTEGVQ